MAMPASSQGLKNRPISRSATAPAPIPVTAHQACWLMKPTPASTKPAAATRAMTTAKGRASPTSQEWVARKGAFALAGLTQMKAVNSPWAMMNAPRRTRITSDTSYGLCSSSVTQREASDQGRWTPQQEDDWRSKSLAAARAVLAAVKVDGDHDQRAAGRDCAVGLQPDPEGLAVLG